MSREAKRPKSDLVQHAGSIFDALSSCHERAMVCGSFRRNVPLIGDLDVSVVGPTGVHDNLALLRSLFLSVDHVEGGVGPNGLSRPRQSYLVSDGSQPPFKVDIWTLRPGCFGAGTLYSTGSGLFNAVMRRYAIFKGFDLLLHGLIDKNRDLIASETEEDIFERLGWPYVEPEERSYPQFVRRIDPLLDEMELTENSRDVPYLSVGSKEPIVCPQQKKESLSPPLPMASRPS